MTHDDLRALADALDRIARTHAIIAPAEPKREPLSYDERWWVSAIEPLIVLRRIDAAKLGAIADADQQGKLMIKTRLRAIADCIHALHRAHSAQPVQAMGTGATGNATNAEQVSTAHAGEMPAKLSAPSDDPIRRAEAAMGFPSNSCLSSRHAASIAETLIKYGTCPMLANDPVLCGKSILETVAELWETRAARDELRRQLAEPKREPNPDEVICPACTHQFRAIPENVQKQLWAKREPLSDSDAAYWLRHRQAILDAIRREGFVLMSNACGFWLKRMDRVSEAHGIGGSDEHQ